MRSVDEESDAESAVRSSSRWTAVAAVIGTLVFASSLLGLFASVLESPVAVGVVATAVLLAVGLLWRAAATADERDAESAVWSAIPSWQYDGRHAESGGITRSEQERSLRNIQQQADELEKRERN